MEALAFIVVMLGNEWLTPHELCGTSTAWNASGEERLRRAHRGTPFGMGWKCDSPPPPISPMLNSSFFFVDGRGLPSQWGCDWQSGRRSPGCNSDAAGRCADAASGCSDAARRHAPCANRPHAQYPRHCPYDCEQD